MPHWLVIMSILVLIEAAYQLGRHVESSRKSPYCYSWRCPYPGCKYHISAQSAPTFNWAIYKHTEEYPDHMTKDI